MDFRFIGKSGNMMTDAFDRFIGKSGNMMTDAFDIRYRLRLR